jgi:predicted MFS family arabinose efflux permease
MMVMTIGRLTIKMTMFVENNNPMDRKRVISSAVAASALGAMFYNLLPLILGVAQDYRALNYTEIGLMTTLFFSGFTLTSLLSFFWIRRFNWKKVNLIALAISCLALFISGFFNNFTLLKICMFVAGGAFSVVYGIGTTALSDTSNPARCFGLKISAEALLGAVLLLLLPGTLIAEYGYMGLITGMVLAVLILVPILLWMPEGGSKVQQNSRKKVHIAWKLRLAIWMGLLAIATFMFSATMVWAFVERMANEAGFRPVLVGYVLSLTLMFAMLGSLLAAAIGSRFGSAKPFTIFIIIFLVALAWLSDAASILSFAIGSCLLSLAIGGGVAYAVSMVSDIDLDGRCVVLTVPALGFGVMFAPVIGGMLTAMHGFTFMLLIGGVTVVVSLIFSHLAVYLGMPFIRKPQDYRS